MAGVALHCSLTHLLKARDSNLEVGRLFFSRNCRFFAFEGQERTEVPLAEQG